jgi:polyribonucleotide nucleotidyltransferase
VSTKDFGAFVEIAAGTDGMCHISELAEGYVKNVTDVVRVGDVVKVKVIMIDDQGRIKLSRKAALAAEGGGAQGAPPPHSGEPQPAGGGGGRGRR